MLIESVLGIGASVKNRFVISSVREGKTMNERYFTATEIAKMLTNASPSSLVTKSRVEDWIRQGRLKAEKTSDYFNPYRVKESDLLPFLQGMGYDAELLFSRR
jgi:hypothetical protein